MSAQWNIESENAEGKKDIFSSIPTGWRRNFFILGLALALFGVQGYVFGLFGIPFGSGSGNGRHYTTVQFGYEKVAPWFVHLIWFAMGVISFAVSFIRSNLLFFLGGLLSIVCAAAGLWYIFLGRFALWNI